METIALTMISLAVGSFITWLVTRFYYVQASKDLVRESEQLRRMVNGLAFSLEKEGLIEPTWDDNGNLAAMKVLTLSGTATGTSHASANATITKRTPEN